MSEKRAATPIGWREWLSLPDIGVAALKGKTDTGARTSALSATRIRHRQVDGVDLVQFCVRPDRRRPEQMFQCETQLIDERRVTNSGGQREMRCVINTTAILGEHHWPIEVTLTDRSDMMFPMLLGRTALAGRFLVDPSGSYLLGHRRRRKS